MKDMAYVYCEEILKEAAKKAIDIGTKTVRFIVNNPKESTAIGVATLAFIKSIHIERRINKNTRIRAKEERMKKMRVYDHSIKQYIYLTRPMTYHEINTFGNLRDKGMSVREALDVLGLRKI